MRGLTLAADSFRICVKYEVFVLASWMLVVCWVVLLSFGLAALRVRVFVTCGTMCYDAVP